MVSRQLSWRARSLERDFFDLSKFPELVVLDPFGLTGCLE